MAAVTRSASASPSVLLHSAIDASLFPLKSITDVVNFFRRALEQNEPDLTLLSIIAGYIELSLTTGEAAMTAAATAATSAASVAGNAPAAPPTIASIVGVVGIQTAAANMDVIMGNTVPFPVVTHELVAGLYKKFQSILAVVDKPKSSHSRQATREVIKKVSDVIWHSLIRSSYKDRAHLQNLYSYLSGNKLDCFGVALAVVAGCQMLGYRDVHLAISEDHAWVVFGHKRIETIEVTWHGKGSEDKRGQDITAGIESGSWLYLSGLAVVCDRAMEVAAIASAINISLTGNSDCVEVAELQQKLLWLLHGMGHLKKYPMALGTLGELEEINPTHKQISCEQLYREAIQASREHYRNHHVYPYTYQGNYYNRLLKYRDAFASWANAGDVIRLYTYNCRDDEEIYKELLDIANEMIPYVMKTESSGHSARSILRDSEVFANLLRFYDGICQWEEDSLTPILHIGWAKPLVNNITKFDYDIRSQVVIKVPEDDEKEDRPAIASGKEAEHSNEAKHEIGIAPLQQVEGNNNNLLKKDEKKTTPATDMTTTLADLTAACGEKILNPDFLLQGGGQPFAEQKQQQQQQHNHSNNNSIHNNNNNTNNNNVNEHEANGMEKIKIAAVAYGEEAAATPAINDVKPTENRMNESELHSATTKSTENNFNLSTTATSQNITTTIAQQAVIVEEEDPFEFMLKRPIITLYSQKMKGLKDLLLAEKLNTHAISLQVTAQSVASKKVRGIDKLGNHTTNSTYATINVTAAQQQQHQHHSTDAAAVAAANAAAAATAASLADSIAVSRPKRKKIVPF